MEKADTKKLLYIFFQSYPNTYKDTTSEERKNIMRMYFELFKDIPTPVMAKAVENYVKDNVYPPSPAGLQKQIDLLMPKTDTEQDLWNLLSKAVSRSAWYAQEEYDKLPEVVRDWVGDPKGLQDLGKLNSDTFQTVTRGQFLKTIKEMKERKEVQTALPDSMRDILKSLPAVHKTEK